MNLPPNPGFNRRHVGVCAGVVSRHNAFRTHQHSGDPAPKPAANGTWVPAGTMAAARSGAATALLTDGRVLVTGGSDAAGATLSAAEFFNSDGSFTAAPPMNFARSGHTATLLQDGRVLVAGGTSSTGAATDTAETYDPASNSWTAAGPLMAARSGQTATLLQNGQLLLAGGAANGAALATLELFDPMSNAF